MIAVICPVCEGIGKIGWYKEIACHGCEGKGWVEVHNEPEHSYPMTLPELYPGNTVTLYPANITYVL